MTWASREADKRARHGKACTCLDCIGRERYLKIIADKKAENDREGRPSAPPGWHAVRRRLRIVT